LWASLQNVTFLQLFPFFSPSFFSPFTKDGLRFHVFSVDVNPRVHIWLQECRMMSHQKYNNVMVMGLQSAETNQSLTWPTYQQYIGTALAEIHTK
jgi:hypothetical protein